MISSIGDGHLTVEIDYSKLSLADIAYLKKPVLQHPIYKFNYKVIAGRLYITANLSGDSTIAPGTEILSLNDISNLDGRGLIPDIPVAYTIADYLAHKDLEMDWVMTDIDQNKEK